MEHVDERDVQIENGDMQEEAPKVELKKASFWVRLLAHWIDFVLIYLFPLPFLLPAIDFELLGATIILVIAYLFKDSIKGQSLGKFIFGLAVRKRDNHMETPSFGRRILRNITWNRFTGTDVYRIKRRKIWVALPLFLAFCALAVLMIALIPERDTITAEEFTAHMEEWNLTAHDYMHNLSDEFIDTPIGSIETYLRVETPGLIVEFIVFSTDARARSAYAQTVQSIEHLRAGGASSHTQMGFSNFNRFTQTGSGQYVVVSRIGNTLVYAHTLTEHRANLNRMLRELGY